MQTAIQSATFHGQQLSIIDHDSRKWLTSEQIGLALGYSPAEARTSINRLFKRHEDEFAPSDVSTLKMVMPCEDKLTSQPQARDYRIFSDTGCIKLGFFASTPRAKEFRTWASKELAGRQERRPTIADFPDFTLSDLTTRLVGMVPPMLKTHSLRQAYVIANSMLKADTGIDVLSHWPISLDELDNSIPLLPGRKLQKSETQSQLDKLARYLARAKHLPVPKHSGSAELIAGILAQGYVPRQVLLKVMHVPAAEFNLLIAEGKEAGIVRELDGIEFNYAGALYVAGGAA